MEEEVSTIARVAVIVDRVNTQVTKMKRYGIANRSSALGE
jgi:hypothetical protein